MSNKDIIININQRILQKDPLKKYVKGALIAAQWVNNPTSVHEGAG